MQFNQYQDRILTFLNDKALESKHSQLTHGLLGLGGESGEALDIFKKSEFQGHEFDRKKFILELGDVLFSIAECADAVDCSLEDIALLNIEKLSTRYPNGFTVKDSVERKESIRLGKFDPDYYPEDVREYVQGK